MGATKNRSNPSQAESIAGCRNNGRRDGKADELANSERGWRVRYMGAVNLSNLKYSDPVSRWADRYYAGELGPRDTMREEAFTEIAAQAPGVRHTLSLMLTVGRRGFLGTEATQDQISRAVCRLSNGKAGERTVRDALQWACRNGYLSKRRVSTGNTVQTSKGDYIQKKICKYTLRARLLMLLDDSIPIGSAPLKCKARRNPSVKTIPKVQRESKPLPVKAPPPLCVTAIVPQVEAKLHYPTPEKSSYSSLDNKQAKAGPLGLPALAMPCTVLETTMIKDSEESGSVSPLSGDELIQPSEALASERERIALRAPLRGDEGKGKNRPHSMLRRGRSKQAKTWANNRRALLHDLFLAMKPEAPGADPRAPMAYRVAELQTDPLYPVGLPVALDWDRWVLRWLDMSDHAVRRRFITGQILPALLAHCDDWTPPEDPAVAASWSRRLAPVPPGELDDTGRAEFFEAWQFTRPLLSLIHRGVAKYDPRLVGPGSLAAKVCAFYAESPGPLSASAPLPSSCKTKSGEIAPGQSIPNLDNQ